MSALESFVVPIEEIVPSEAVGSFKPEPQQIVVVSTNSETTTNNILTQGGLQDHLVDHQDFLHTEEIIKDEPVETEDVKTVIINEEHFFDNAHVGHDLAIQSGANVIVEETHHSLGVNPGGGISYEETSGAVASVLADMPTGTDDQQVLRNHWKLLTHPRFLRPIHQSISNLEALRCQMITKLFYAFCWYL